MIRIPAAGAQFVPVDGHEVVEGDVLVFPGTGTTYRVDRDEPASPATCEMNGDPHARVAYSGRGNWSINLIARQPYPILPRPAAA